jgi:hypothetical protein
MAMKKFTKWSILAVGIVTVLLITLSVSPVQAQDVRDSGAIWTPSDCGPNADQDIMEFPYGSPVYIAGGNGLLPNTQYYWSVGKTNEKDPMWSGNITTDGNGEFCFTFRTFMPGDDTNGGNPFNVDLKLDGKNVSQDNFKILGSVLTNSVNVTPGACSWTVAGGSERAVTLTITGASVTITRTSAGGGSWGPFTSSTVIDLPEGSYHYSYVPTEGYNGTGGGDFTVDPCPPASASHQFLGCDWTELGSSLSDVKIFVSHAELTLSGPGGVFIGTYTMDTTVEDLAPGHYTYTWHAVSGYSGAGTGWFDLLNCEPEKGDASVSIEACVWDETNGSTFIAHISVANATLTINGKTYDKSGDIELPAGYYEFTWTAVEPYTGGGSGSIDVDGCEPATVNVVIGGCEWVEMSSLTPVTITIHGALLDLYQAGTDPVHIGQYGEGTSVVTLSPGSYYYTWTAVEDFTGSGGDEFDTISCEPGKADATVNIGACTYSDGQSLTLVSISVSNAILTIDGQTFSEKADLKLLPGEYTYSWKAMSDAYQGEGSGTLIVGSCEPKEDEEPDVPAGGSGPSLMLTLTPMLLIVSGIAIAWALIKYRVKKI